MKENEEEKKKIDFDDRGNPLMTVKTIKYFCSKDSLFETPLLNEKLYLHFKGFRAIDSLENYPNLITVWLNNNSISKIQGLSSLKNLICLYLNNNVISKIQNLSELTQLTILNLAHNRIDKIEGLSGLKNLTSLNVSENFLSNADSLSGILESDSLNNVNLSKNQIESSEEVFRVISSLGNLSCLYMKGTHISRGFKNYRKRLIAGLPKLKFLDDRPVQQIDHRLAEAWAKGGIQCERIQRNKIAGERQTKKEQQVKSFSEKLERERKRELEKQRIENYIFDLKLEQKSEELNAELEEAERRLQILKDGPKGFQAAITSTSIKILNASEDEQQGVISKYFQNEKKQIQENLRKLAENQVEKVEEMSMEENEKQIERKVKKILKIEDEGNDYYKNWKPQYEGILEALLEKHKFDFSEVQPQFNMILSQISKKMIRPHRRFEVGELQHIWTDVEIKRRLLKNQENDVDR